MIKPIKISFSHVYQKMPLQIASAAYKTYLFGVFPFFDEQVSESFLEWDTRFLGVDESDLESFEHYPLPEGRKLLLLLGTEDGSGRFIMWQTIRRHHIDKEKYYMKHLNEQVEIVIGREIDGI